MSLLDPLSRPRWQHPKAEVRLAAVDELDDREILLKIVQSDDDPAVRSRALARIEEGAVLDRLIDNSPGGFSDELRQQARAQRLHSCWSRTGPFRTTQTMQRCPGLYA